MADELKPCPFCGGCPDNRKMTYFSIWEIECEFCLFSISRPRHQEVIESWNSRAPDHEKEALVAMVKELEEGLRRAKSMMLCAYDQACAEHGFDEAVAEGRRVDALLAARKED